MLPEIKGQETCDGCMHLRIVEQNRGQAFLCVANPPQVIAMPVQTLQGATFAPMTFYPNAGLRCSRFTTVSNASRLVS